jgi:adsorption protein B
MGDFVVLALLVTGVLILISSLDDMLVDILTVLRVGPTEVLAAPGDQQPKLPSIAVFVANWHEADVLDQMVEGNLANITNPCIRLVLGVYPNDVETKSIAEDLAKKHPDRVQVIVNRRSGPTSKGQMLNEMFSVVFRDRARAPDLVVLHDSEDVIAPRSFEVHARESEHSAMIQIPVFSLDARDRSTVGATYMEEFAERHTREMILRAQIGACIPSAGVGTCLRKDLILHFLDKRGHVLQADSVTEDYLLGTEAHRDGFKTTFAAIRDGTSAEAPIIATLEYFPKSFWASVKQKTRWVYGIAFQGTKRIGWSGNAWDVFFLYRDRKGAFTNLLPLVSLLIMFSALLVGAESAHLPPWQKYLLWFVLAGNTISIFVRLYFKAVAFRTVYGAYDVIGIVLRWPLGIIINAVAVASAWRMFIVDSRLASRPVAWAKTRHELPAVFLPIAHVQPAPILASARASAKGGLAVASLAAALALFGAYVVLQSSFAAIEAERARMAASESLKVNERRDESILALAEQARSARPRIAMAGIAASAAEEETSAANEEWRLHLSEDREIARGLAKSSLSQSPDDGLLQRVVQRRQSMAPHRYLAQLVEEEAFDPQMVITPEDREQAHDAAKRSLAAIEIAAMAYIESARINRPAPNSRVVEPSAVVNDIADQQAASLADISIQAIKSQDTMILARAAHAKRDSQEAVPRQDAVPDVPRSIVFLMRDAPAVAESAAMPEPETKADIRAAQRAANGWMLKHHLSVQDLGLTMRSHCGRILCVDGILGPRTRQVMNAIRQRDTAFQSHSAGNKG